MVDSEQESMFFAGQLKQPHPISRLRCRETGTSLRIKADDLLGLEIRHGLVELRPDRINQMNPSRKARLLQTLYFFCFYAGYKHLFNYLDCFIIRTAVHLYEQQFAVFRQRPHLVVDKHLKMVCAVADLVHEVLHFMRIYLCPFRYVLYPVSMLAGLHESLHI